MDLQLANLHIDAAVQIKHHLRCLEEIDYLKRQLAQDHGPLIRKHMEHSIDFNERCARDAEQKYLELQEQIQSLNSSILVS